MRCTALNNHFPPRKKKPIKTLDKGAKATPPRRNQNPHSQGRLASIPDRRKTEPHPHCTDTAAALPVGPIKPATYQYAPAKTPVSAASAARLLGRRDPPVAVALKP